MTFVVMTVGRFSADQAISLGRPTSLRAIVMVRSTYAWIVSFIGCRPRRTTNSNYNDEQITHAHAPCHGASWSVADGRTTLGSVQLRGGMFVRCGRESCWQIRDIALGYGKL